MKTSALFLLCFLFLAGLVFLSCKGPRAQVQGREGEKALEVDTIPMLIVREGFRPEGPNRVNIRKAWLEGKTLLLNVSYSGGCKDHSFELVFNKMVAKSLPPQVGLYLVHQDGGDRCKKMMLDTLRFNLSPLAGVGPRVFLGIDGYESRLILE